MKFDHFLVHFLDQKAWENTTFLRFWNFRFFRRVDPKNRSNCNFSGRAGCPKNGKITHFWSNSWTPFWANIVVTLYQNIRKVVQKGVQKMAKMCQKPCFLVIFVTFLDTFLNRFCVIFYTDCMHFWIFGVKKEVKKWSKLVIFWHPFFDPFFGIVGVSRIWLAILELFTGLLENAKIGSKNEVEKRVFFGF